MAQSLAGCTVQKSKKSFYQAYPLQKIKIYVCFCVYFNNEIHKYNLEDKKQLFDGDEVLLT